MQLLDSIQLNNLNELKNLYRQQPSAFPNGNQYVAQDSSNLLNQKLSALEFILYLKKLDNQSIDKKFFDQCQSYLAKCLEQYQSEQGDKSGKAFYPAFNELSLPFVNLDNYHQNVVLKKYEKASVANAGGHAKLAIAALLFVAFTCTLALNPLFALFFIFPVVCVVSAIKDYSDGSKYFTEYKNAQQVVDICDLSTKFHSKILGETLQEESSMRRSSYMQQSGTRSDSNVAKASLSKPKTGFFSKPQQPVKTFGGYEINARAATL